MKKYRLNTYDPIPSCRKRDVTNLKRLIAENLGISISMRDTYELWSRLSESFAASWLCIPMIDGEFDSDSMLDYLERYGVIVDEDENDEDI